MLLEGVFGGSRRSIHNKPWCSAENVNAGYDAKGSEHTICSTVALLWNRNHHSTEPWVPMKMSPVHRFDPFSMYYPLHTRKNPTSPAVLVMLPIQLASYHNLLQSLGTLRLPFFSTHQHQEITVRLLPNISYPLTVIESHYNEIKAMIFTWPVRGFNVMADRWFES